MSVSAITQPDTYMAAYSAVPVKLFDNDVFISDNYKYLINICYDDYTITSTAPYAMYGDIYTECIGLTNHPYVLGDYLLLDDSANNNDYTNYYIVKKITSPTSFVIDLVPSVPFGVIPFTTQKFIKYQFNPDLDGYAKIDLSNVLKDFVSQNLTGQSVNYGLMFDGPDTRFCYDIKAGSQKNCVLEFDDNIFSGGVLGFIATGITSLNDVCFQIGDTINVQQDVYGWAYLDNVFISGAVGYTGATAVPFPLGATITITGQITNPTYNGLNTITAIPSPNLLQTATSYISATPVEPGVIYGVPKPEYNGVCNITNIFIDPILGYLVILTDKSFTGASPVLPGNITFADNRITRTINELSITGMCVFNAHLNKNEYTITEYDKYTIQNRTANLNNLSTILGQNHQYRVLPETIAWLLQHNAPSSFIVGQGYTFYDSNNNPLGSLYFSASTEDIYLPVGLNQIANVVPTNDYGTPFSSYTSGITSYCIYVADDGLLAPIQYSNSICFEIDTECTKYEIYHLMWKDKLGSWISYPFKYVSRDNMESELKTYYQQEGTWENNTFGYDDYGRGEKNFYLRSRKSIIVNSGWLYEFERDLMEDLIQSPFVYLQTPDNRLYGGKLEETKLEIYKQINEDLFAYSFNFIFASNEYRF
jgi:hypothetical protein